jgi:hypothetical protein
MQWRELSNGIKGYYFKRQHGEIAQINEIKE